MFQDNPEIVATIIAGTILILFLGIMIIVFAFAYQRKHNKYVQQTEQLQKFEQELLRSQLEIQEQTFKNISQEIHDNIGQVLSLVKLNIARMDIARPELLAEKISDSKQLISKAIQDLRDLSRSMNTEYIAEMGLPAAINYEMEMMRKIGSFETKLHTTGKVYKLEKQKELILFRIIQELLNNILKHSRGTIIDINLQYAPEQCMLVITDNGDGFDPKQYEKSDERSGLGLRNMRNRAQLIGGEFEISSEIGKGTRVTIRIDNSTLKNTSMKES